MTSSASTVSCQSLDSTLDRYQEFLRAKVACAKSSGVDVSLDEINPALKPFQCQVVQWAVKQGRCALFETFGLGKTIQQLETIRILLGKIGSAEPKGLIVAPLGVRQEFTRDARERFAGEYAINPRFVRRTEEIDGPGIYLSNYESIRDGRLDPSAFDAVSLDEADVLRSFGSETFGELVFGLMQQVFYRFVATATPSPNQYLELIAYAAFLGIMDMGESKTRFFKRNSEQAKDLTLLPHKEEEFWLWVSTWALFVQWPSDLGTQYSNEGYDLPPMHVKWHEVPVDHSQSTQVLTSKRGQARMFREAMHGVSEAAKEKRESLDARMDVLHEILCDGPDDHFLIWHDLEVERKANRHRCSPRKQSDLSTGMDRAVQGRHQARLRPQ